jgi:hypothetical protein
MLQKLYQRPQKANQGLGVRITVDSDPDEEVESGVSGRDESSESGVRVEAGVLTPPLELAEELGVLIPPLELSDAAGVSIASDEDELAVGVWTTFNPGVDTDVLSNPAPNPPLMIPPTEHHAMYSSSVIGLVSSGVRIPPENVESDHFGEQLQVLSNVALRGTLSTSLTSEASDLEAVEGLAEYDEDAWPEATRSRTRR